MEEICMPRQKSSNKKGSKNTKRQQNNITNQDLNDLVDESAFSASESPASSIEASPSFIEKQFDSAAQALLSKNEHYRFVDSSHLVGHALLTKDEQGRLIAQQFSAPGSDNPEDPKVLSLTNIELFQDKYGTTRGRAKALDGTDMISKRSISVQTKDEHGDNIKHELMMFSPKQAHVWNKTKEVFWGSDPKKVAPIFRDDLSESEKKDLEKDLAESKYEVKGGELDIVNKDVPLRENMTRTPSQKQVMNNQSAIDAYLDYYSSYGNELSPVVKTTFENAEKARPHYRGATFASQRRPEWCHALGHGLTPMNQEPQRKDNLAAAPKYINTEMMKTERALKWHAMHRPNAKLHLSAHFNTLPNSDIMKDGKVEGILIENDREVKLTQQLNPFQWYPNFSKATDIMQTTMVTHNLLNGTTPSQVSEIKIEPRVQKGFDILTQPGAYSNIAMTPVSAALSTVQIASTASTNHPTVDQLTTSTNATLNTIKTSLPTSYAQQKSVVKIFSTFQQANYEMPWLGSTPSKCTGSGFVYRANNKSYVITNAHVIEDCNHLELRIANDEKRFVARVKQVSHQADIALLEVDDPEFQAIAQPVELGDMIELEKKIKVVGFPMGGEELSITKGIVSRIEVDTYAQSGERMLQVQTDSAINPGNSGGPVFYDNKVVGIAFQGYDQGQNLGYFIPIPILKHFLKDTFENQTYKGYPTLNIAVQPLYNRALARYFGLQPGETGVRVNVIDDLSDAHGKLLKDDVILAIDGIKIGNDAKTTVPEIGNRIDFNYLFHRKQVGETINVLVSRRDPETGNIERKNIDITLKYRPGQTKKVEAPEHVKDPTYYINSGIIFQPLTNNYLETARGAVLRDVIIPEVGDITNIPKKTSLDQFVIINQVLDCEKTSGYDDFENCLVKEINGQKISNIQDVVSAMQSNKEPVHRIETSDGELMVMHNFSPKEHEKLLKQYRIFHDRSQDLNITPSVIRDHALEMAASNNIVQEVKPQSDSSHTIKTDATIKKASASKTAPKKVVEDLFVQGSENDSESDNDSDLVGFIVSDDADLGYDSDASAKDIAIDETSELFVPQQSLIEFATKSGKKYSPAFLSYLDTVDQLANRYAGHNVESALSEEDADYVSNSESDDESESEYDSDNETENKSDMEYEDHASQTIRSASMLQKSEPVVKKQKTVRFDLEDLDEVLTPSVSITPMKHLKSPPLKRSEPAALNEAKNQEQSHARRSRRIRGLAPAS